jgi:hypothetical protein
MPDLRFVFLQSALKAFMRKALRFGQDAHAADHDGFGREVPKIVSVRHALPRRRGEKPDFYRGIHLACGLLDIHASTSRVSNNGY